MNVIQGLPAAGGVRTHTGFGLTAVKKLASGLTKNPDLFADVARFPTLIATTRGIAVFSPNGGPFGSFDERNALDS
jgi:hypothetical protein